MKYILRKKGTAWNMVNGQGAILARISKENHSWNIHQEDGRITASLQINEKGMPRLTVGASVMHTDIDFEKTAYAFLPDRPVRVSFSWMGQPCTVSRTAPDAFFVSFHHLEFQVHFSLLRPAAVDCALPETEAAVAVMVILYMYYEDDCPIV